MVATAFEVQATHISRSILTTTVTTMRNDPVRREFEVNGVEPGSLTVFNHLSIMFHETPKQMGGGKSQVMLTFGGFYFPHFGGLREMVCPAGDKLERTAAIVCS
jgi:hypothetical protein